jgi:hypothetical protein
MHCIAASAVARHNVAQHSEFPVLVRRPTHANEQAPRDCTRYRYRYTGGQESRCTNTDIQQTKELKCMHSPARGEALGVAGRMARKNLPVSRDPFETVAVFILSAAGPHEPGQNESLHTGKESCVSPGENPSSRAAMIPRLADHQFTGSFHFYTRISSGKGVCPSRA